MKVEAETCVHAGSGGVPDKLHELAELCLQAAGEAFPRRTSAVSMLPASETLYLSVGPSLFTVRHARRHFGSRVDLIEFEYLGTHMKRVRHRAYGETRKSLKPAKSPGQLRFNIRRYLLSCVPNDVEFQQYSRIDMINRSDMDQLVRDALTTTHLHAVARRHGCSLEGWANFFRLRGSGITIKGDWDINLNKLTLRITGDRAVLDVLARVAEFGLLSQTRNDADDSNHGHAGSND